MLLGEPGTWNLIDPAFVGPAETSLHFFSELPVLGLTVTRCPLVLFTPYAMFDNVLDHNLILFCFTDSIFNTNKLKI